MNTFDKFLEVYRIDNRNPMELAQGFLWYHCQATNVKSADLKTIQQYYHKAIISPPSAQEIALAFSSRNSGVVSDGEQYRVLKDIDEWFHENYYKSVFEAGLRLFKVDANSRRRNHDPPVGWLNQLWHWPKDHPAAAWLMLIVTVIGVVLAVVK